MEAYADKAFRPTGGIAPAQPERSPGIIAQHAAHIEGILHRLSMLNDRAQKSIDHIAGMPPQRAMGTTSASTENAKLPGSFGAAMASANSIGVQLDRLSDLCDALEMLG